MQTGCVCVCVCVQTERERERERVFWNILPKKRICGPTKQKCNHLFCTISITVICAYTVIEYRDIKLKKKNF